MAQPLPALPPDLLPYASAIQAHLHQPTVWFVPLNQLATGPAESKIGGWPYLPAAALNPLLDADGLHRYNLLVQLNLAELPLPRPPHLPTHGVLQLFTHDYLGVLDEDPGATRWVYYPAVTPALPALVTDFSAYALADLEGYQGVPAEGLRVAFQSRTGTYVAPDNYGGLGHLVAEVADPSERTRLLGQLDAYVQTYNDALPDIDNPWLELLATQYPSDDAGQPVFEPAAPGYAPSLPEHQLGGLLAQFWQGDPRPQGEVLTHLPYHDQLLLAYDNRGNCTEWGVPFLRDDAKLLFFINRDRLQQLDFSDVFYSYMA